MNRSIAVGREMEKCNLFWLEDPIHHQDYDGLAHIANALDTPISAGEYHYGIPPFRHMLERRSVDIVMIDLLRAGGITPWMKIAHLAEAYNLPVVSHLAPEVLAHGRCGRSKWPRCRAYALELAAVQAASAHREQRNRPASNSRAGAGVRRGIARSSCALVGCSRLC